MKLVITTQYRENYGTVEQPYWKNKGGSTYVVDGVTSKQEERIRKEGVPTLQSLIEYSNMGSSEQVIGLSIVPDQHRVGEEWEIPIECKYDNGRWVAIRHTENDEYGFMRQEIAKRIESYLMCVGGEREAYEVQFYMRDGSILLGNTELAAYFEGATV